MTYLSCDNGCKVRRNVDNAGCCSQHDHMTEHVPFESDFVILKKKERKIFFDAVFLMLN